MASYVEEFVAFLGWEVDNTELEKFEKQVDDLGGMLKKTAAIVAGAAASLTALTAIVNQATAANVALAKSVGVSSEFLEAMGAAVAPLGFEMENVIDLVEEMNNKIGESKGLGVPMTAVTEATRILGLEFKKIKDLAPEEQFIQILDAAKNLEDQQAAVSAVDILMGGEANRILGFLRTQDESLLELIQKQMELNMLTDAGRKGAERFNNVFIDMKTVINSAKQEFFGLLGNALSPLLEEYSEWIRANNKIIKSKIKRWAKNVGRALDFLFRILTWFVGKVDEVVEALGGLESVLRIVGIALAATFGAKAIMALQTFIRMIKLAGTEALLMNIKAALVPAAIMALIALLILLGEDLYHFFTGGESALGKLGDHIAKFVHSNIRPTIANFLGMTPEQLDRMFLDALDAYGKFWDGVIYYASIGIEKFVDFIKWVGNSIVSLSLEIGKFALYLKNNSDEIIQYFDMTATAFIAFVKAIPTALKNFIMASVADIAKSLKGLPIVGDLIGDVTATGTVDSVSNLTAPGVANVSPGVRTAVTNANNQRTTNQRTQMTNQFNITQSPGESGEDLANRVSDILQRESARAVSANDSGIEI